MIEINSNNAYYFPFLLLVLRYSYYSKTSKFRLDEADFDC